MTLTLNMTTAQVVETSVTATNSSFQNYTHPDYHTCTPLTGPLFRGVRTKLNAPICRVFFFESALRSWPKARRVFHITVTRVLVGFFERNPSKVPRSCFVGAAPSYFYLQELPKQNITWPVHNLYLRVHGNGKASFSMCMYTP